MSCNLKIQIQLNQVIRDCILCYKEIRINKTPTSYHKILSMDHAYKCLLVLIIHF